MQPMTTPIQLLAAIEEKAARFEKEFADVPSLMAELRRKVFALHSAAQSRQQPSHVAITAEMVAALAFLVWKSAELGPMPDPDTLAVMRGTEQP